MPPLTWKSQHLLTLLQIKKLICFCAHPETVNLADWSFLLQLKEHRQPIFFYFVLLQWIVSGPAGPSGVPAQPAVVWAGRPLPEKSCSPASMVGTLVRTQIIRPEHALHLSAVSVMCDLAENPEEAIRNVKKKNPKMITWLMATSETWNTPILCTKSHMLILKPDSVDIWWFSNRSQFGTINMLHSACVALESLEQNL